LKEEAAWVTDVRVWVTERIGFVPSDVLAGLAIESVTFAISSPAIESTGIEEAAHSSGVLESMANAAIQVWKKELQMNLTLSIPIESTSEIHFTTLLIFLFRNVLPGGR
jgi:hypothetical protein